MSDLDAAREQQRESWDKFSGGWEKWDHVVLPMLAPVGDEMLRLLDVDVAAEHLDIASGTGEPALSIAEVATQGRVVLTDLSTGMLAAAERAAAKRGITNIELRACSADDLPFPDESFDSASCRFGIMFIPDMAAGVREIARVLRPGGKVCAAVWAEPGANLWASMPIGIVANEVGLTPPPPDAPGIFRCAAPGAVASLFTAAGLRDVEEVDVRAHLVVESAPIVWDYLSDVAAPVVGAMAQADDATRARIRAKVLAGLEEFVVDGEVRIPLHARCVVATK